MSQSLDEHSEIIEAIRSGDAGQASLVPRQHVMIQGGGASTISLLVRTRLYEPQNITD